MWIEKSNRPRGYYFSAGIRAFKFGKDAGAQPAVLNTLNSNFTRAEVKLAPILASLGADVVATQINENIKASKLNETMNHWPHGLEQSLEIEQTVSRQGQIPKKNWGSPQIRLNKQLKLTTKYR